MIKRALASAAAELSDSASENLPSQKAGAAVGTLPYARLPAKAGTKERK